MRYPTPEGVPVVMTLPACNVDPWLQCAMIWATEKSMFLVLLFCRNSPLIRVSRFRDWGSWTN